MQVFIAILLALSYANALKVEVQSHCAAKYKNSGLSKDYYENIGHAIHSMTVQGLRKFHPKASALNKIPTVNHNVTAELRVLPFAPDDPIGNEFASFTMNTIDKILSNVGRDNDGLGKFWSPIERAVHNFHMWDLWERIRQTYENTVVWNPPSEHVCSCLDETDSNGIYQSVAWVADHYKSGTPITLLGRPIPKLTDAETWLTWKDRLLHYYNDSALQDAAIFMYCTTRNF